MHKNRIFNTHSQNKNLSFVRYGLKSAIILTALGFSNPLLAETPVTRTGVFLSPPFSGGTQCDGIEDQLESAGEFIVDGTQYLGEKTFYTVAGLGKVMMTGETDLLFDEINGAFDDLGNVAGQVIVPYLNHYTPLGLMSIVVDVLPDGDVTSFLKKVKSFQEETLEKLAKEAIDGANPLKVAAKAIEDFSEIAEDISKVLVNLDDPLSAGNEFLKLNQKWTGVGALTYILTEDNPMAGMKKGLLALHRQFEIVTTYGPGRSFGNIYKESPSGELLRDAAGKLIIDKSKTRIAKALISIAEKNAKKYIESIPNNTDGSVSPEKKAAATLLTTFSATFFAQITDPNFVSSDSRHPMYSAEFREVYFQDMGNDAGSGGNIDHGFLQPIVEDRPGCISLGDYAYKGSVPDKERLTAVCNVESGRNEWWSRPVDYKLLWSDACSGAKDDRSIWLPVCEAGYISVGFVSNNSSWQKPLPNRIACIKNNFDTLTVTDGNDAGLNILADDKGSGAKFFDLTVYNRKFLGMDLMYAVNKLDPDGMDPKGTFLDEARVAVPSTGSQPSGDKADCVNFYSEPNFKGRTHAVCGVDNGQWQALNGDNNQMVIDGSSTFNSFQCGQEVASIELYNDDDGSSKTWPCHDVYEKDLSRSNHKVKIYSSYTSPGGTLRLSPAAMEELALKEAERLRLATVFESPQAARAYGSTYFEFQVMIGGYGADSFTAIGLPPGLSLDPTWGVIRGEATTTGTYYVTITATNEIGNFTQKLVIAVNPQELVVSSTADNGAGSLRDTIASASPGDTITFDESLSGKSIILTDGDLNINKYLFIDGSDLKDGITVDGDGKSRVFSVGRQYGINKDIYDIGVHPYTVTIDSLTITGGFDSSHGAGIETEQKLYLYNSTFHNNSASWAGAAVFSDRKLHIENSTFFNNTSDGGAVYSMGNGLTLVNSTIVGNHGGGLKLENTFYSPAHIENTIISGDIYISSYCSPICEEEIITAGRNLIGNNSGIEKWFPESETVGTAENPLDPMLFELGNYGGPTLTMPPLPGSPAIDKAIMLTSTALTDQRGTSRPSGTFPDIGAVEIQQNSIDGLSYIMVEVQNTASAMVLGRSSGSENTVIVIPDNVTINGITYPVTSVAPKAFENSPITSVTIGSNVTIISELAFCGSPALTSVTIPDKMVRIDKNAFCDVESVKFLGDYSTGFSPDAFNPTAGFTIEACFDSPSWNGVSFRTDQADVMVSPCDNSVVRKDINGDGKADILWRNHADGRNALWTMDGMSIADISLIYKVDDQNWKIVGRGDFNGDKKSDILWRNNLTGLNYIWMMDGFTVSARQAINTVANLDWQIKAVADFNGDNKSDILWHQQKTGRTHIYLMDGFQIMARSSVRFVDDLNWQIAAAADVNADGKSDVIWRNQRTGLNYIWLMDGYTLEQGYVTNTVDGAWDIVGAGDLNGDGHGDIVWRNQIDGRNWAHLMKDGKVQTSQLINIVIEQDWQITDVLDLDGDGSDDLFWRNISSGSSYIYLMDGIVIKDRGFSNTVDTDWQNIH